MQRTVSKGADRRTAARVATKVLIQAAMARGSRDNITVLVVDLLEPEVPCCRGVLLSLPERVDVGSSPQLAAACRAAPPKTAAAAAAPGGGGGVLSMQQVAALKLAMLGSRRQYHGDKSRKSLLSAEKLMITI